MYKRWFISGLNMIVFSIRLTPFHTLSLIGKNKKSKAATDLVTKVIGYNADCNKNNKLNEYEFAIASQVINPNSIKINWNDIGGIPTEHTNILKTDLIRLLKDPSLIKLSNYYRPPKGILLYGPSGTGKTMLAQATAKESNANFINLDMCNLISKWYGEPIKLARAVFTLAKKISPCIIFIEEIDSFLSLNDQETSAMMKSQFLQLWDDFADDTNNKIIVMGTTNRKSNIDKAILSRMELRFEIKLPDFNQRIEIFRKMLRSMNLDSNFSLDELAALTDSFSGRDIESICKEVNMKCLRECLSDDERENSKDLSNTIRQENKTDELAALIDSGRDVESICKEVNMKFSRECLLDDERENSKDLSNTIRQVNMNDFINAIESKKFN